MPRAWDAFRTLFHKSVGETAIVWVQNPIRLPGNSLPQPDLALLRPRSDFYEQSRPTPTDVLLIVEVSDTTLVSDIEVKVPLYAEAGIPEVWIVNLQENIIEVYSSPNAGRYESVQHISQDQSLPLPDSLKSTIRVSDILG